MITESVSQGISHEFLKSEGKILAYLLKNMNNAGQIYSKDIQKEFGIKKGFTSTCLTSLETKGLIFRKKEGKKRRIFITKQGQKAILGEILNDDEIKTVKTLDISGSYKFQLLPISAWGQCLSLVREYLYLRLSSTIISRKIWFV